MQAGDGAVHSLPRCAGEGVKCIVGQEASLALGSCQALHTSWGTFLSLGMSPPPPSRNHCKQQLSFNASLETPCPRRV